MIVGTGPGAEFGEAVRWNTDGTVTHLGTLESGKGYTVALDINDSGVVVGSGSGPDGHTHAVAWTSDGAIKDLPLLPGAVKSDRQARAVSNDGTIVGVSQNADFARTATRWTVDGEAEDLGSLPGRGGSDAYAINDNGMAVGDSTAIATRWTF
ncbi:hypothetical protein [Kutzneria buriramensis]|uniref:Putative HAF family extracellular repeat protein n=1 Tax=Kutzneria buriramensis TaxID=1045776 RepID=A0A3E0HLW3_9PSEU|nr:hypothetical protein [Kutzneria buriramensis]REH47206.1 putative HAF family extracellular repeat protein [Kutzneria buriramensis]